MEDAEAETAETGEAAFLGSVGGFFSSDMGRSKKPQQRIQQRTEHEIQQLSFCPTVRVASCFGTGFLLITFDSLVTSGSLA